MWTLPTETNYAPPCPEGCRFEDRLRYYICPVQPPASLEWIARCQCVRFRLDRSATTLAQQPGLADLPARTLRCNIIALTQEFLNVVRTPSHPKRQSRLIRWGLMPVWGEGPAVGACMINDGSPERSAD